MRQDGREAREAPRQRGMVVVTGGTGYIGATVVDELRDAGFGVRVVDSLLHGQDELAAQQRRGGVDVIHGDLRDPSVRAQALTGVEAVVHLAAIVGDPACAKDPTLSDDVNVQATRALLRDAASAECRRFVFASTCSNYGRMADPTVPIDESGELRPMSLYAQQKVEMEKYTLQANAPTLMTTCLRFATVYGAAPRMRFDLTVNEFTRELWADRKLEVFGEQFWRPYIHVRDAARAIRTVLHAREDKVAGQVFNAGNSSENYRKLDIVEEIRKQTDRGSVVYVQRDEDPRDYKVSFEKIRTHLGFETHMMVPDGIAEMMAALDANAFGDPYLPDTAIDHHVTVDRRHPRCDSRWEVSGCNACPRMPYALCARMLLSLPDASVTDRKLLSVCPASADQYLGGGSPHSRSSEHQLDRRKSCANAPA